MLGEGCVALEYQMASPPDANRANVKGRDGARNMTACNASRSLVRKRWPTLANNQSWVSTAKHRKHCWKISWRGRTTHWPLRNAWTL